MFLDNIIFKSYEDQMEKATAAMKKGLNSQVEDLRVWGERWSGDMTVPAREYMKVPVMYELGGEVTEVYEEKLWWPLQAANKNLLKHVDNRLLESFREIKRIGFKRSSSVLYGRMFVHVHSDKMEKQYYDRITEWAGVTLVLRRIRSTARVAYRYEQPDTLGRRVIEDKDGNVTIRFGKAQWRRELVQRGVIPKKQR